MYLGFRNLRENFEIYQNARSFYLIFISGLREAQERRDNAVVLANPILPDNVLQEAVPGNIRKGEHFVAFMKRLVEYLKTRLRVQYVMQVILFVCTYFFVPVIRYVAL